MYSISRQNKISIAERFWLCMLFLFAVSIFNKGGYILMAAIALFLFLHFKSIRVDMMTVYLVLFSISYSIIHTLHFGFEFTDFCNHFIAPWGAYLVGKYYTGRFRQGQPLVRLMLVLAGGLFLHGMLNILLQIAVFPVHATYGRMAYDIWHAQYISVTGAGMLYTLMTGMAFGFLFSEVKKSYKVMALFIIGIAMLYSIELAHRTTTALIAVILMVYLVRWMILEFRPTRKNIFILMMGILAVIFLIVCICLDIFGLRTWITGLNLYVRLTDSDAANSGSRLKIWLSFLKNFLFYPVGGRGFPLFENQSYVHNMWMDIYYKCGIVPTLAILGMTWSGFRSVRKLLKSRNTISLLTRNCLFFISVAFVLNAAVEPVLDANPYFLFAYLMILGGAAGLRSRTAAGGEAP